MAYSDPSETAARAHQEIDNLVAAATVGAERSAHNAEIDKLRKATERLTRENRRLSSGLDLAIGQLRSSGPTSLAEYLEQFRSPTPSASAHWVSSDGGTAPKAIDFERVERIVAQNREDRVRFLEREIKRLSNANRRQRDTIRNHQDALTEARNAGPAPVSYAAWANEIKRAQVAQRRASKLAAAMRNAEINLGLIGTATRRHGRKIAAEAARSLRAALDADRDAQLDDAARERYSTTVRRP